MIMKFFFYNIDSENLFLYSSVIALCRWNGCEGWPTASGRIQEKAQGCPAFEEDKV